MAPSKKLPRSFLPPEKLTFAKPIPELVGMAILMLHAQVKAAREKEAAKGKATPRRRET
jgi:hypothetical protein